MIPQQIPCMVFPNRNAMRSTKKTEVHHYPITLPYTQRRGIPLAKCDEPPPGGGSTN